MSATPASVHLPAADLVFKLAQKTKVGPRNSVLYTGHMYMFPKSAFSAERPRIERTGMPKNISLGLLRSIVDAPVSQRAPYMLKPHT